MAALSNGELAVAIKERAAKIGFSLVGIAPASRPDTFEHLAAWIAEGKQGGMDYIPRRLPAYADPNRVLEGVRSVVMVGLNHGAGRHDSAQVGRIAAYAQGSVDYHDVLRDLLKGLADCLHHHRPGCRTRIIADTAPLLERDFARRAGLGWFGKNTLLINKGQGSLFLLGAILTDCELPGDAPHATSHCGTCTRCLEACPTDAFDGPYRLDARKCISYWTIEMGREPIPEDLRSRFGDWLFGCDICQTVCPWNRKPPPAGDPRLAPELPEQADPFSLLTMDELEFKTRFARTPLSRPGWVGMARNAAVVLGNSSDPRAREALQGALSHPVEHVRETARRCLERFPT